MERLIGNITTNNATIFGGVTGNVTLTEGSITSLNVNNMTTYSGNVNVLTTAINATILNTLTDISGGVFADNSVTANVITDISGGVFADIVTANIITSGVTTVNNANIVSGTVTTLTTGETVTGNVTTINTVTNYQVNTATTVTGNVTTITSANVVSGNVVTITTAISQVYGNTTYANGTVYVQGNALGAVTGNVFIQAQEYVAHAVGATIGANTRTAGLSGASFTLTLGTAVGLAGKMITFLHLGTSLTQEYTIDGDGTETIDGTTTYILYTNGERLTIVSDGANWIIMDHTASTAWANSGPLTINATSVNPIKADSANTPIDMSTWRREGDQCYFRYDYTWASNVATATNGTGDYLVDLPTGITIATPTPHRGNTTNFAAASFAGLLAAAIHTTGTASRDNSFIDAVVASVYDSTRFRVLFAVDYTDIWGSTDNQLKGTTAWPARRGMNFEIHFTHANWRR